MTRKLDKEHLDEIMQLRDAFAKNSQILGNIYLEEYSLKRRFDMLDSERANYIQQFSELQKQEQDLLEKMRERYGDGEINIAQGTFTPNQKEEIIENIRNHPQIIRMNLDGVERPFTPYFDPY